MEKARVNIISYIIRLIQLLLLFQQKPLKEIPYNDEEGDDDDDDDDDEGGDLSKYNLDDEVLEKCNYHFQIRDLLQQKATWLRMKCANLRLAWLTIL